MMFLKGNLFFYIDIICLCGKITGGIISSLFDIFKIKIGGVMGRMLFRGDKMVVSCGKGMVLWSMKFIMNESRLLEWKWIRKRLWSFSKMSGRMEEVFFIHILLEMMRVNIIYFCVKYYNNWKFYLDNKIIYLLI